MAKNKEHQVYSADRSASLEMSFRKYLYSPKKLFGHLIKPGMSVLDMGCGPGFFTLPAAEMVSASGKVIAVDLQAAMLDKIKAKIKGKEIEERIVLYQSKKDRIGLSEKVDLVLALFVVHELPDSDKFFQEAHKILKPNGCLLIIEPSFEVNKQEFSDSINAAENAGFKYQKPVKAFLSHGALLKK